MDREFWNQEYRADADGVMVPDRIVECESAELPVGSALDLGCGIGTNALRLAARGWSVVGVDWADEAIAIAASTAEKRGLAAEFLVADTTTWEPRRTFDLVICTYALPGGDASRLVLETARSALAIGGTLIVAEWDRSMASAWGFEPESLPTPQEIVAWLPGLAVVRAEVVCLEGVFSGDDDPRRQGGDSANAVVVRARREAVSTR